MTPNQMREPRTTSVDGEMTLVHTLGVICEDCAFNSECEHNYSREDNDETGSRYSRGEYRCLLTGMDG